MKIEEGFTVRAPRERVWAFLTDPAKMAPCIPGCGEIQIVGPNSYRASVRVAIGPIKAEFRLEVEVEEEVPPSLARSVTRGEEGTRASTLLARSLLALEEIEPGATAVRYSSDISVVGRLGKFGLGVMKKKAEALGAEFARAVRDRIEAGA
ncbi:MAG TPA: SRPBCC domain-containing protein [Alphaproteobacteria bacterium]|nr:SRPBCC domain-containing protein [Alphaproteobacteria bacterium]